MPLNGRGGVARNVGPLDNRRIARRFCQGTEARSQNQGHLGTQVAVLAHGSHSGVQFFVVGVGVGSSVHGEYKRDVRQVRCSLESPG